MDLVLYPDDLGFTRNNRVEGLKKCVSSCKTNLVIFETADHFLGAMEPIIPLARHQITYSIIDL